MSRARATALALVNWKGVFFERYLLDPHVTALEGANGAGKTTVMIAAYLVLLPDLTRLRFTNLGETAATGGDRGIYGRLGVAGRPSYAALELELAGERVILAVHLERKGEPSVQATTFMVHGLARTHGLSSLFLLSDGKTEGVPELAELKTRAAELGARVEVFDSLRDYFGALFERGIVPLRLANDDDRAKFNEMLRTSMTGGISRALTTELRTFLLKEESGLSDTLSRMRANLDTCRRTRVEVQEARALEREITGVYEAGASMFGAALAALEAELREARRQRDAERTREHEARLALAQAEATLADGVAREEVARKRLGESRSRLEAAKERREALRRASELERRAVELRRELEPAEAASAEARAELERRQAAREAAKRERAHARDAHDKAARGLANLQNGLEELHRRAHAFRRGRRVLEEARLLLELPELDDAGLEAALRKTEQELARIDAERARRGRELAGEHRRREEFARAEGALLELVSGGLSDNRHAQARKELARLAELAPRAGELASLATRLERAREERTRRTVARGRLEELGLAPPAGEAVRTVEALVLELTRELFASEERVRELTAARRDGEEDAARLTIRLSEARAQAERRVRARASLDRLATYLDGELASADDARTAREKLGREREALRGLAFSLQARREGVLGEALRLDHEAGGFEASLVELCEELGGEFLAARFEELDVERAARVQAGLGALASAIVVADVPAALAQLERSGAPFGDVHLVRAGQTVAADDGEPLGARLLAVPTEHGVRVTRLPERPTLGRHAREARRSSLLEEAERLALDIERASSDARRLDALLADADELVREAALAFGPDPAELATELEAEQRAAAGLVVTRAAECVAEVARSGALKQRLEALRGVLADAHVLDRDGESVENLEQAVAAAQAAEAELTRTEASRAVLAECLDALRVPPPSSAELERFERERAELDQERDRWFRGGEAVAAAIETRQARGYTGAEAALEEGTRLVPALESELEGLAGAVAATDAKLGRAEALWEEQASRFQDVDARRAAAAAHAERVASEMTELAPGFSVERLAWSELEVERDLERVLAIENDAAAVAEELGSLRERKRQAELALAERSASLADEDARIEPLERRRDELVSDVSRSGLLTGGIPRDTAWDRPNATERELLSEARSRREVLVDRLLRARGGQALAEELAARFSSDAEPFATYVAAWRDVTAWLGRRLPSQVAEVADPLAALDRLREHLSILEGRLGRQDLDLRGASEDVARGIEVKLRRASSQVRRLNQHLAGISFGSIASIRVELRRLERMEQILRALREGQAQELLFQSSLPVEEALEEIFRRYGGGGKTGGQRLLDYREYLELEVEVERKGKPGFEPVSPTRLSTGEAIGVGAALMMVVLTEWERDANLFRSKKTDGTLRFLFLDEANRLSQDNLGVLFDLCENLELQLLIAAPEVARASGNTTYRLVRKVADDGSEEVLVTGRRGARDAPDAVTVVLAD
jgi:chromosome partition protein MukB